MYGKSEKVNGFQPLMISLKSSIMKVWRSFLSTAQEQIVKLKVYWLILIKTAICDQGLVLRKYGGDCRFTKLRF